MCNPRKVNIRTVVQLAEAWTAVLVGTAVVSTDTTAEATLTQPYGENLPPAFRVIFERRLGSDPAWSYREGVFRSELDSGYIAYDPQTGELEFSVCLTEQVSVEGRATVEVSGELRQTVDRDFEGTGRTDAEARTAADAASQDTVAQERTRLQAEARRARAQAGEDVANLSRAETLAREDAARRLEEALGSRAEELSEQARAELETRRNEYLRIVNRVYAGALQEVMEAFARRRGAFNIESSEQDGIIDISFELERAG
jgi:hypothetical protein